MSETQGVSVREALLQRLRFERSLGLEALPRAPLAPAAEAPHAPAPAAERPAALPADAVPARTVAPPAARDPETPGAASSATVDAQLFPMEGAVAGSSSLSREERFDALRQRALACTKCPLHRGRTNVVFGEGPCPAQLVFVGEGPGADEDRTGRPFVGKAGQLLNKIIGAMGFKREEVYIANVVKCRPPENRTPLPDETAACWPYLEEQLALLEPKVIVALGSPAAKTLLKTSAGITQLRGRWQLYRGIRVMSTYHPAFVLRKYTLDIRGHVWSDMQQVMEFLKGSDA